VYVLIQYVLFVVQCSLFLRNALCHSDVTSRTRTLGLARARTSRNVTRCFPHCRITAGITDGTDVVIGILFAQHCKLVI
jgi:hypothetical protein